MCCYTEHIFGFHSIMACFDVLHNTIDFFNLLHWKHWTALWFLQHWNILSVQWLLWYTFGQVPCEWFVLYVGKVNRHSGSSVKHDTTSSLISTTKNKSSGKKCARRRATVNWYLTVVYTLFTICIFKKWIYFGLIAESEEMDRKKIALYTLFFCSCCLYAMCLKIVCWILHIMFCVGTMTAKRKRRKTKKTAQTESEESSKQPTMKWCTLLFFIAVLLAFILWTADQTFMEALTQSSSVTWKSIQYGRKR